MGLGVFFWVALPESCGRASEVGDGVVGWRRTGGDLRIYDCSGESGGEAEVFRVERSVDAGRTEADQRADGAVVAGGAASDLSGGGDRRGICAEELRELSVELDRDAFGVGADASGVRAGGFREGADKTERGAGQERTFGDLRNTREGIWEEATCQQRDASEKPVLGTGVFHL